MTSSMQPIETPSAQCLRAIEVIELLCESATRGPWEPHYDGGLLSLLGAPEKGGNQASIAIDFTLPDTVWIAMFGPNTAPIWVKLLRDGAEKLSWAGSWLEVADCAEKDLVALLLVPRRTPRNVP